MRVIAVVLLAASLQPVANWLPGGETDPAYAARLADWALGAGLCFTVGVLAWFVSRGRMSAVTASARRGDDPMAHAEASWVLALCVLAMGVYMGIAFWVFSGRPLLIDEIVHVLQARDLAAGQLTHEIPGPREFFSILHEVDFGPRAYGQYPVGGPAMLVPGVLLGATWLVGPTIGALCVGMFWVLLRSLEPESSVQFRLGTTLAFAAAPFGAFMFGSHMNHTSVLLWLLLAAVSLVRATSDRTRAPLWGLATGLGLGIAATIRPLDAGAFALPAAAWLIWRARAGLRPFTVAVLSGVGVAIPLGLALWANAATTGHPLQFGYDLLWGDAHRLGFHASPWGSVHTPVRGLELVSLYLTRLNTYLFELPFPSLLLPAIGLWSNRRLCVMDRFLLAAAGLVAVGYWAYWHDGFFLGPRFLFSWLPVLVLWSARGVRALWCAAAGGGSRIRSAVGFRAALMATLGSGLLYAAVTLTLVRAPLYRNGLSSMRLASDDAAPPDVHRALVFVQESWGAQLVVRLWALGISRSATEALYSNVDACVLEESLRWLEAEGIREVSAYTRLQALMSDSAKLEPSNLSPDDSEMRLPGLGYTPTCIARIEEDRRGYLLYAPWRLVDDGNMYARWLPGREDELRALYPERPAFLLRRAGTAVDAPLVWERLTD
ncbi:MAG: hypothetical protein ACO377_11485 [Pseudomonadales bacterium]